ncbi:hypothetical protein F5148DRAFT_1155753 [Russula earlei]|uniref:Uncharacterized protein n=1 Tax=Russula earlei TaxID=71964 RepID=A0ACC0UP11_9AGAM|nr:hypothetical protein F5148DRAFT_1155753 [Russula earlei]
MFLAGLIMVTRNRILAWPSLLLGLSAWINQHPLRTKEGGTPPIGNLMHVFSTPRVTLAVLNPFFLLPHPNRLALTAVIAAYLPLFVKPAFAAGARQVPLDP